MLAQFKAWDTGAMPRPPRCLSRGLAVLFLLGLSILPLGPSFLLAAETVMVGQIAELSGRVKLERGGRVTDATVGDELAVSDVIRTNAKGRVRIELGSGATMTIGPESRVRLTAVVKEEETLVSAVIDLLRGIARFALSPDARRERFEVRTRLALVSVRSTRWVVESYRADHTAVFVIAGEVVAEGLSPDNAGRAVMTKGKGVDITERAVGPPKAWGQARIDDVLARSGL